MEDENVISESIVVDKMQEAEVSESSKCKKTGEELHPELDSKDESNQQGDIEEKTEPVVAQTQIAESNSTVQSQSVDHSHQQTSQRLYNAKVQAQSFPAPVNFQALPPAIEGNYYLVEVTSKCATCGKWRSFITSEALSATDTKDR